MSSLREYVTMTVPGDQVRVGDLVEDGHVWHYVYSISPVIGYRGAADEFLPSGPWYVGHIRNGNDVVALRPTQGYAILRDARGVESIKAREAQS